MKLVGFLKKLRHEQVTVELKNGTTVWGTLQNVSPQMNVSLTDVRLSLPRQGKNVVGGPSALASLYLSGQTATPATGNEEPSVSLQYINIRGNTLRQIILPDSLNLDALLVDEEQLNRLRRSGKVSDDASRKRKRDFAGQTSKRSRRGV